MIFLDKNQKIIKKLSSSGKYSPLIDTSLTENCTSTKLKQS